MLSMVVVCRFVKAVVLLNCMQGDKMGGGAETGQRASAFRRTGLWNHNARRRRGAWPGSRTPVALSPPHRRGRPPHNTHELPRTPRHPSFDLDVQDRRQRYYSFFYWFLNQYLPFFHMSGLMKWTCAACTLSNQEQHLQCSVCGGERPQKRQRSGDQTDEGLQGKNKRGKDKATGIAWLTARISFGIRSSQSATLND